MKKILFWSQWIFGAVLWKTKVTKARLCCSKTKYKEKCLKMCARLEDWLWKETKLFWWSFKWHGCCQREKLLPRIWRNTWLNWTVILCFEKEFMNHETNYLTKESFKQNFRGEVTVFSIVVKPIVHAYREIESSLVKESRIWTWRLKNS